MKLIVAKDLSGAIGKGNQMPWHLSDDLKNFRKLTTGGTVLMGRKTYESIGKPLPNRVNLILSREKILDKAYSPWIVSSIDEAIEYDQNLWVIGGGEIYKQTIDHCTELHLTVVQTHIKDADTFFPNINLHDWITKSHFTKQKDEKNQFTFTYYHLLKA